MKFAFSYLVSALVVLANKVFLVKAIRYGALDEDAHPYVGLMVALDASGKDMYRCSGSFLSSKVFLTAGHCTFKASRVEIWFDADVDAGRPDNGYPFTGDAGGMPITHLDYDDEGFTNRDVGNNTDVGVVLLDRPYESANGVYATLPSRNQLDAFKTNEPGQKYTIVGYGFQYASPVEIEAARVRMNATVDLIQINDGIAGDNAMVVSNNAVTGGPCYGDNGGPAFFNDSNGVAGVVSFGSLNQNCAGTGVYFRMDRASALDWVLPFLNVQKTKKPPLKN